MQAIYCDLCWEYAFSGLRSSARTVSGLAKDSNGTAIMAYAFLAGLVALAATVAFTATGTAVANMYDVISTTFVASMPS